VSVGSRAIAPVATDAVDAGVIDSLVVGADEDGDAAPAASSLTGASSTALLAMPAACAAAGTPGTSLQDTSALTVALPPLLHGGGCHVLAVPVRRHPVKPAPS